MSYWFTLSLTGGSPETTSGDALEAGGSPDTLAAGGTPEADGPVEDSDGAYRGKDGEFYLLRCHDCIFYYNTP